MSPYRTAPPAEPPPTWRERMAAWWQRRQVRRVVDSLPVHDQVGAWLASLSPEERDRVIDRCLPPSLRKGPMASIPGTGRAVLK